MTDVTNVDENVVNDVIQGGIMTGVRTDVNVNDVHFKDDHVANDDSRDREVLTDVCNDAKHGVYGSRSTMDKVCSDVVFETDVANSANMDAGVKGDVCTNFDAEKVKWTVGKGINDVNAENDESWSRGAAVDVCSDAFSDNFENDVNRSGSVMVDVCSDINVENGMKMTGHVVVDVCSDVFNGNIGIDVSRTGNIVVDVCIVMSRLKMM